MYGKGGALRAQVGRMVKAKAAKRAKDKADKAKAAKAKTGKGKGKAKGGKMPKGLALRLLAKRGRDADDDESMGKDANA